MADGRRLKNREIAICYDDAEWVFQIRRSFAILNFQIYFYISARENSFCVILPNFVETGHAVAEISRFFRDCFFLVKCVNSLGGHV